VNKEEYYKFAINQDIVITKYIVNEMGVFLGTKSKSCFGFIDNGAVIEFNIPPQQIPSTTTALIIQNNHLLASLTKDIYIWDFSYYLYEEGTYKLQPKIIMKGHSRTITGLYIWDNHLYSSSTDETLRVWDIVTHECIHSYTSKNSGLLPAFNLGFNAAFGECVFVTAIDEMQLIKLSGKGIKVKARFQGHLGTITAIKIINSFYVFTASADRTVRIWDIKTGNCLLICSGHKSKVTDMTVKQNVLFASAEDGYIRYWFLDTGKH